VQAIAKWLLARPHNAILGLTVTLLLPASQLTGGAIIVLLVLAQGVRFAVFEASIAAAVLMVASLLLGGSLSSVMMLAAGSWIPAVLLALSLLTLRSLTLTLQLSVIVAIAALLVFQIAVPDPAAFWQPYLDAMVKLFSESGLQLDTELLTAEVMTISAVLAFWTLFAAALLLGYWLYQQQAADAGLETAAFGQFRDLNFGRVIAFAMTLASLLAFVIDKAWLKDIAFVLFVMFMMQGLAMVHWLYGKGKLPLVAVVSMYVMLPFLQVLLVIVLAVIGYTDAWFDFRRRFKTA